jgi:hypothetical protein
MKVKIEIKNRFTGKILFELETENNTVRKTLIEAVPQGADLQGADLQGAYLRGAYLRGADLQGADLQGADLQGADLRGADLQGKKIKSAAVFTGLYKYTVIPYVTEKDVKRVKMGCYDRTVSEWESDFWNNNNEFPNDGSVDSNLRLMAFQTALKWFEITAAVPVIG